MTDLMEPLQSALVKNCELFLANPHNPCCKFWNEADDFFVIILWMSCLLSPHLTSLLNPALA
jgi:hypothetical protein